MDLKQHYRIGRYIAAALFTAVFAATWDVWWHGAIGRDTLFEPPHLLLYGAVIVAVAFGVVGWYRTRQTVWKRLAVLLLLIPITAPFDELWHQRYGVEDIASPIIVWSPPHLAIIFAVLGSIYLLFPVLRQDPDEQLKRIFMSMMLAAGLSMILFALTPLNPLGPWHILGFWAASILAIAITLVYLLSEHIVPGHASATMVLVFLCFLLAVGFGERIEAGVEMVPHDHSPSFLLLLSFALPAIFVDISRRSFIVIRGAVVGLLWGATLFGFSSMFFAAEFKYTFLEGATGVLAAVVGGILAACIVNALLSKKLVSNN